MTDARKLAKEIVELKREARRKATSAELSYSSIEDGALDVNDSDGNLRATWGKQFDGTVSVTYTNGPTPGAPAAPFIVAHQLSFLVQWDGMFEEGSSNPRDLAHIEVHVSEDAVGGVFEPSLATLVGTIPPEGGALTVTGDNDVHYVCTRALTTSGEYSEPSDFQSVTPLPADVVIGDELIGKTVTGGVVRTAATGPRVELNATEDVQSVFFYASDGSEAHISQADYVAAGTTTVIGSGIEIASSIVDDKAAGIALLPDAVALTQTNVTTDTVMSQIVVSGDQAVLAAGPEGYGNEIWVSSTGARMQSIDGNEILVLNDGIWIRSSGTVRNQIIGTPDGNWSMYGAGDVGGPQGGILKIVDKTDNSLFLELDNNEIQANPFGTPIHLNKDSRAPIRVASLVEVGTWPNGSGDDDPWVGSAPTAPFASGIVFGDDHVQCRRRSATGWSGLKASNVSYTSDPEFKADIEPIASVDALADVKRAPLYRYRSLVGVDPDPRVERGIMSIDLPEELRVSPTREGDPEMVSLNGLVTTLWGAVQELTKRLEALES